MHASPTVRLLVVALGFTGGACVDVPLSVLRPRVGAVDLVQGNNQVTQVGSDAVIPQIRVLAPDLTPLRGIEVRYSVNGAGGSVTPSIVRTDSLGIAQPRLWSVRSTPGPDTLVAIVVGVGTYRFIATVTPPCMGGAPVVVGDSVNGLVATTGCLTGGGRRATTYQLTGAVVGAPYSTVVRMTGAGYRGRVELQQNGRAIATSAFDTTAGNRSGMAVFLPPGAVTMLAQAELPASTGAFGLATAGPVTITACPRNVFIARGASSTQSIDDTNCTFIDNTGFLYYGQAYRVRIAASERIVVRQSSAAISCFLLVIDPSGANVLHQVNVGTSASVSLEFTAPATGYYVIVALSSASPRSVGGPYTISVDP